MGSSKKAPCPARRRPLTLPWMRVIKTGGVRLSKPSTRGVIGDRRGSRQRRIHQIAPSPKPNRLTTKKTRLATWKSSIANGIIGSRNPGGYRYGNGQSYLAYAGIPSRTARAALQLG